MAINTENNSYTVLFAGIMVLVVGALLASVAMGLKPAIKENERFEKQQNILYAMGVHRNDGDGIAFVPTTEVEEEFRKYITRQYVITGSEARPEEEAYLIDLKKQMDALKSDQPARLPIFVGEKEGKTYYVIPMYGKGLWDAIWGYMSLDEDLVVQGVFFDHKAETPGLGANIKARYFMDDFVGESVLDGNQYAGIGVVKGNNDPNNNDKQDNEVDALAGATITGNGVTAMIKESLNLYRPFLETVREN